MNRSDLPIAADVARIRLQHGSLLNQREAADLLGVNVRTLETWRKMGTGPEYVKLGDYHNAPVRYPAAKLRTFLEQYTVHTEPLQPSHVEALEPGVDAPPGVASAPTADPPSAPPATGLSSLRTVKDLAKELRPCGITEASIRWHLFNADRNGLNASGAVVRPPNSRRVFIDRNRFERWIRSRSAAPADPPGRSVRAERSSPT